MMKVKNVSAKTYTSLAFRIHAVFAGVLSVKKMVALFRGHTIIQINNTPHASRKICAPWGVTCFLGGS